MNILEYFTSKGLDYKQETMSDEHNIPIVEEVARYLRVTERHIYKLLSNRKIPAFKVGGAWYFRKEEVDRWIIEQERN